MRWWRPALILLFLLDASCVAKDPPATRTEGSFVSRSLTARDGKPLEIDRPSCGVFGAAYQIAICEGGERQVVVMDSTGREVWRFGRRGAGPGEFHTITGTHFDSHGRLHVFDGGMRKLVLISADGQLISDRVFHQLTGWLPASIGELADGSIVLLESTYQLPGGSASEGYQRVVSPIGVLDTSSRRVRTVDTVSLFEQFVLGQGFSRQTFGLPFGATGSAVLAGDQLVRGFARDPFLVRVGLSSGATDTIPLEVPAFELPDDVWNDRWQERIANATPDSREALSQVATLAPRPDTYPRYVRMLVTPGGSVAIYAPVSETMEEYAIHCALTTAGDECPEVTSSEGEIVLAIASGRALVARETADGTYMMELWVPTPH
jgi:hypothetical protein